jgi:hypothetical protein
MVRHRQSLFVSATADPRLTPAPETALHFAPRRFLSASGRFWKARRKNYYGVSDFLRKECATRAAFLAAIPSGQDSR